MINRYMDTEYRIQRIQINKNHLYYDDCITSCTNSKNVRNKALYKQRQFIFNNTKVLSIDDNTYINNRKIQKSFLTNTDLYHLMKKEPEFNITNTKIAKQTLIEIEESMKSIITKWKKGEKASPPAYSKKYATTTFPNEAISVVNKNGYKLSGTNIFIKFDDRNAIREVKIIPFDNYFEIHIVYKVNMPNILPDNGRYCGGDLGVNLIIALASNVVGVNPLLINGGEIKSINQYYNKRIAELKSKLPKDVKTSKRIHDLWRRRNNKITNYLHHVSCLVVDYCKTHNLNRIVIGKNFGWKIGINMGRKNNQNFAYIPHAKLIDYIVYKANDVGIAVSTMEESYTSKCSFLDKEDLRHQDKYIGRRIHRGLFKSNNDKFIHADINGSLNILRKSTGYDVFDSDLSKYIRSPMKLNPLKRILKDNPLTIWRLQPVALVVENQPKRNIV